MSIVNLENAYRAVNSAEDHLRYLSYLNKEKLKLSDLQGSARIPDELIPMAVGLLERMKEHAKVKLKNKKLELEKAVKEYVEQ